MAALTHDALIRHRKRRAPGLLYQSIWLDRAEHLLEVRPDILGRDELDS
jgi:hypothetical protein